mgnify:CR=1 FL=1
MQTVYQNNYTPPCSKGQEKKPSQHRAKANYYRFIKDALDDLLEKLLVVFVHIARIQNLLQEK